MCWLALLKTVAGRGFLGLHAMSSAIIKMIWLSGMPNRWNKWHELGIANNRRVCFIHLNRTIDRQDVGHMTVIEPEPRSIHQNGPIVVVLSSALWKFIQDLQGNRSGMLILSKVRCQLISLKYLQLIATNQIDICEEYQENPQFHVHRHTQRTEKRQQTQNTNTNVKWH